MLPDRDFPGGIWVSDGVDDHADGSAVVEGERDPLERSRWGAERLGELERNLVEAERRVQGELQSGDSFFEVSSGCEVGDAGVLVRVIALGHANS